MYSMRRHLLVPLFAVVASCATGASPGSAHETKTYSVTDLVSVPALAPRISTDDLVESVRMATGSHYWQDDTQSIEATGSGSLMVSASPGVHSKVEIVLRDIRRFYEARQ